MEQTNRLNFSITESLINKNFTVTLTFTNSIEPTAKDFIMQLFPIEFYSCKEIKIDNNQRSLTVVTTNKEMVESLKKMITKWFRKKSNLDNINLN